jgi:hypothetical protein
MRTFVLLMGVSLSVLASTQALAVKKFIPLGHSDLEQTGDLPAFGSETSDFNLQADIYETRNYLRAKELRETDSYLRKFESAPDNNPANRYIDY